MVNSNARRLADRYEVRSLIGRGGMAQVHLGFDTRLSRVVAIKMLRVDLARDSIFQTRFHREAQAAASLNHPNIVGVYDTGAEQIMGADGKVVSVPYIVMEYVEGHTVKELINDGTPVPINEAVEITAGILSALEYSHAAGLVHRDIKPGNIMLTNDGQVKVMDFGIARAMADSQATMTATNAVVGTAQYLSPEQARGEQVDIRSDIYSTGCVLFELLTGRPPFRGDSAVAVAYQHVSEVAPAPSTFAGDIPESLDRVTMRAMAKNAADRYDSASLMRMDMIRALEGQPVDAPPVSVWGVAGGVAGVAAGATAIGATAATVAMGAPTATRAYTGPLRATGSGAGPGAVSPTATQVSMAPVDGEEGEPKKSKKALWITLIVVLALALVGVGAYLIFLNEEPVADPIMTTVPTGIINTTQADARTKIAAAGLEFELVPERVFDPEIPDGNVVSVDPSEGTEVETKTKVKVTLSKGKDSSAVPSVVGKTQQEAEALLKEAGFTVGTVTEEDNAAETEGKVLRTDPGPGATEKAGAKINLIIASGYVTVPIVTPGQSVDEYRELLRQQTLAGIVDTPGVESDLPEGTVVSVSPTDRVRQGETVYIKVSAGPKEEVVTPPPTTESPAPTIPTSPAPGESEGDGD